MRFHVVSLPHTHTTSAFSSCAFTQKVVRFCQMMKSLGHTVFLYSGEQNEAPCDEHVVCVTEESRLQMVGSKHYTEADWNHPLWRDFCASVVGNVKARLQPQDFVCLIGGVSHQPVAAAFPNNISVEFGIGYSGTFAKFRVFESYAWMHMIYGQDAARRPGGSASAADGHFYDDVIPNQFDPAIYACDQDCPREYLLYAGRKIDRKGVSVAQEVASRLGKRLVLAGPGTTTGYGEDLPPQSSVELARLMNGAVALFAPTLYVEPFGTVAIEAMACGTPVISTDWGAFTETVPDGYGWRCRTLREFMDAAEESFQWHYARRYLLSEMALKKWSMDVVAEKYESYFQRLLTLYGDGWYTV